MFPTKKTLIFLKYIIKRFPIKSINHCPSKKTENLIVPQKSTVFHKSLDFKQWENGLKKIDHYKIPS